MQTNWVGMILTGLFLIFYGWGIFIDPIRFTKIMLWWPLFLVRRHGDAYALPDSVAERLRMLEHDPEAFLKRNKTGYWKISTIVGYAVYMIFCSVYLYLLYVSIFQNSVP